MTTLLKRAAKRRLFGVASKALDASGERVVDNAGDFVAAETLEEAGVAYLKRGAVGKLNHKGDPVFKCVELAYIDEDKWRALGEATGVEMPPFRGALLWIGLEAQDQATWDRVESGELRALSIGGTARRRAV